MKQEDLECKSREKDYWKHSIYSQSNGNWSGGGELHKDGKTQNLLTRPQQTNATLHSLVVPLTSMGQMT